MYSPSIVTMFGCVDSKGRSRRLRSRSDYFLPLGPLLLMIEAFELAGMECNSTTAKAAGLANATGDEAIELLRLGLADVVTPDFSMKPSRAVNTTVIPHSLYYKRISFLANEHILAHTHELKWFNVFTMDVWIIFAAWRILEVLRPYLGLNKTCHKAIISMSLGMIGFFLTTFFRKKFLSSRVLHAKTPFITLDEAFRMTQELDLELAFLGYVTGLVSDWPVPKKVFKSLRLLLNHLSSVDAAYTIGDYAQLATLLGRLPQFRPFVGIIEGADVKPQFAFCRQDLPERHALANAFVVLNDHGLTYGLPASHVIKPDQALKLHPIELKVLPIHISTAIGVSAIVSFVAEILVAKLFY